MGLYINENGHPTIFNNNANISARNQEYSKIDSLAEWMKKQKEANDSVNLQLNDMEALLKQQKNTQTKQLKAIRNRLKAINENNNRHEKFEIDVMKSLTKLEAENRMLHRTLAQEQLGNQEFIGKVNEVRQSNKEIANRIETVTATNEQIVFKMNEQLDHQKRLSEQFSKQDDVQKDVVSRLDNQEGLTEKVVRQLDNLRSVLYERTNFLTKKIEDNYSMTSAYIFKLLQRSDQPSTRFILHQKQEEKKENVD
jgi:hypothetical protein